MSVRPADEQTGDEITGTNRRWPLPRMIASAPWLVLLVGIAVLAVLMVAAALAFRGPEQPTAWTPGPPMVLPTLPSSTGSTTASDPTGSPTATGPTPDPSTPDPTGSTASAVPSPSGSRPSPGRSATVEPSRSAEAPAVPVDDSGVLTAGYRLQDADANSVQAELVVRNGTGRSVGWSVDLAFSREVTGLRASSGPGVSVSIKGGGRYLLSGSRPLAAGSVQTVQLRITRSGGGDYPIGCVINGSACGGG